MTEISIAKACPDRRRSDNEPEPKPGFKLIPIAELMKRSMETDWIIKDYLPADSTVMVFGASQSGKSLIVMEMAYCIGVGQDYHGCPVKQGTVIYIAGEGQKGMNKRFKALTVDKGVSTNNIHVSELPMDLSSAESMEQVSETVLGIPDIKLIIIDTLHRNSTGDENSAKDFATVMQNCDLLRNATGATIMLVHHSGHDSKSRGRGSSSMTAAMDVEYRVSRLGKQVTMQNTKAKDIEPPKDMRFTLKIIKIGTSTEGEDITAPVLIQGNASIPTTKLTQEDQVILDHLEQLLPDGKTTDDDFYDAQENPVAVQPGQTMVTKKDWSLACWDKIEIKVNAKNPDDAKRKRFERSLDRLFKLGKVARNNADYYIIPNSAENDD